MQTVLIDIDDTIFDFRKSASSAIKKAATEYNIKITEEMLEKYFEINVVLWQDYENGKIPKSYIFENRFNMLFKDFNINIIGTDFEDKFQKYFKTEYVFIDGAKDFLKYLSSKYAIYAASNSTYDSQIHRLKSAGVLGYFKDVFISDVAGAQKPTKEFFDYCFKNIPNVKKEETILIGDSLSSDIQGANNAGIKCCWFNESGKHCAEVQKYDYEIDKLSKIKDIL